MAGPRVTLYHSPGCHLCDRARAVLVAAQEEQPFELVEIDISDDEELEASFRELLPVVQIEGGPQFAYFVPPDVFRRSLAAQSPR